LTDYINLFINNLLPIFLAAGAGFLLSQWLPIDPKTLSSITFYIFSPCLVFTLLTQSQLSYLELFNIILFTIACFCVIGLLTWFLGRSFRLERTTLAAVMITAMFMNAGNYGLPATSFAFGEKALAYASLVFVTNAVLTNTAGVVIVSMGSSGFKRALKNLITLPTLYGLILAIIFMRTGWAIPLPIERTAKILGDASIPALLVMMGIQFHSIQLKGKIKPLTLASAMRLLVGPIVALLLSPIFGLHGPARQAAVLESAMPTAVITTVLATQFDTEPSFVSAVVAITTILSVVTLTPLLALLGG
jgi:predicted permease